MCMGKKGKKRKMSEAKQSQAKQRHAKVDLPGMMIRALHHPRIPHPPPRDRVKSLIKITLLFTPGHQ